jgi:hypothetical protein
MVASAGIRASSTLVRTGTKVLANGVNENPISIAFGVEENSGMGTKIAMKISGI